MCCFPGKTDPAACTKFPQRYIPETDSLFLSRVRAADKEINVHRMGLENRFLFWHCCCPRCQLLLQKGCHFVDPNTYEFPPCSWSGWWLICPSGRGRAAEWIIPVSQGLLPLCCPGKAIWARRQLISHTQATSLIPRGHLIHLIASRIMSQRETNAKVLSF